MKTTWQTRPVHRAIAVVAAAYQVPSKQLVNNQCRVWPMVHRRQLVMWLAWKFGAPRYHVAHYMGFDVGTVRNGLMRVERRRVADPEFSEFSDALLAALRKNTSDNSAVPLAPRKEMPCVRDQVDDTAVMARSFGL